jgi:hypothetical protein
MRVRCNMPLRVSRCGLLAACGLLACSSLCFGQTNSTKINAPTLALGPGTSKGVFWNEAANGYFVETLAEVPAPTKASPKEPKLKVVQADAAASPPPSRPDRFSNRMNVAANEQAQYQWIEDEGILPSRAALREMARQRNAEIAMGEISHSPQSVIWGTPLFTTRVLGTGTASGVP